jgi:hypothetical protein
MEAFQLVGGGSDARVVEADEEVFAVAPGTGDEVVDEVARGCGQSGPGCSRQVA